MLKAISVQFVIGRVVVTNSFRRQGNYGSTETFQRYHIYPIPVVYLGILKYQSSTFKFFVENSNSSTMKKSKKQMKHQQVKTPLKTNRLEIIKNVIPIGPRFQADIPDWTGPPSSDYYEDLISSTKWLGIRVWPNKDRVPETKAEEVIGKGRTNFCSCASPGSVECVKRHISDKRLQLQSDLGPAFWVWKFDQVGEEVSKLWNLSDLQKLDCIIKKSSPSQDNNFVKLALERFPTQSTETIVRYYFNVYVPRRIKNQTRSGCEVVDTDDDEDGGSPCPEGSRKRCRAVGATQKSGKRVKNNYLSGRR